MVLEDVCPSSVIGAVFLPCPVDSERGGKGGGIMDQSQLFFMDKEQVSYAEEGERGKIHL